MYFMQCFPLNLILSVVGGGGYYGDVCLPVEKWMPGIGIRTSKAEMTDNIQGPARAGKTDTVGFLLVLPVCCQFVGGETEPDRQTVEPRARSSNEAMAQNTTL